MFEEVFEQNKHIRAGCHKSELELLYNLAMQCPKNALIVEVGSYLGSSAVIMAQSGHKIICVDCFKAYFDGFGDEQVVMENEFKKNTAPYKNIKLLQMESKDAVKKLPHKGINLLFIDGDHSYEGVKLDCELYLPKVKKGGLVAFHDFRNTACQGVYDAVEECTNGWEVVTELWSMVVKRKP